MEGKKFRTPTKKLYNLNKRYDVGLKLVVLGGREVEKKKGAVFGGGTYRINTVTWIIE